MPPRRLPRSGSTGGKPRGQPQRNHQRHGREPTGGHHLRGRLARRDPHRAWTTAEWTNIVEVADVDSDGDLDLLRANSGDQKYWTPVENRVFLNPEDGTFTDATRQVFGKRVGTTRVIKVADVNADHVPGSDARRRAKHLRQAVGK